MSEFGSKFSLDYTYLDYLKKLEACGNETGRVVEAFIEAKRASQIRILPDTAAVISTVVRDSDGHVSIFLPRNYDEGAALFEAPRILFDSLSILNSPLAKMEGLENRVRDELASTYPR